jgi:hypothetical protein
MFRSKGKAMLSIFKNHFLSSLRPTYWDAPEHFRAPRRPHTGSEIERQIAEERHRAMRNVGMW